MLVNRPNGRDPMAGVDVDRRITQDCAREEVRSADRGRSLDPCHHSELLEWSAFFVKRKSKRGVKIFIKLTFHGHQ